MNLLQAVLVLAGIPLAIYGVIALLTLREKFAKTPRYRSGQEWGYAPVLWVANPAGTNRLAVNTAADAPEAAVSAAKGGTSGNW